MKKLIAILLSVLMLCTLIPFAAVSASDEPTIVVEVDEEANAGDEIEVTVNLANNPGVIAATVEILFDADAFELVTYFDEDEEMWLPQIEVGTTFKASSNKYITFAQIDENGFSKKCVVSYIRGTATSNCTKEWFFTATFKVKDTAVSGNYDLAVSYDPENFVNLDDETVLFGKQDASIYINGTDPEPEEPACEHEYAYDCSKNCSKCGEETRPEAAHQYFYACDPVCMICYEMTNPEAAHAMTYVEAKAATCTENGNIAYWTCSACGGCWDNENATGMPLNRMMVIVPAAHTYDNDCDPDCNVCFENREELNHNIIHVDAVAATCTTDGNIEYWYCDVCGMAWLDEACTLNTNLMSVVLPASCSYGAVYTAAKAATCYEPGNTEYWYCANCDVYYADAACAIVTNAKNVIIPITHNIVAVEAKAATCTENGNIAYWYCADCGQAWLDEYCHLNTNLKSVVLPASCSYSAVYTAAKEATCYEPGNTEYWYCANCDVYYADAACAIVTNAKNVIIPITHNIVAVEAKAATCTENGNIAYWYCADCGQAWLDEYCHLNTNLKAVVLPATDHIYSGECDATCNACDNVREVALPAAPIAFGGNSIAEDKTGLAFKFTANDLVDGIIINSGYKADYSNATVIIDGKVHKLVAMGAIVNNQGKKNLTLDNVNGEDVLDIVAKKVFDGSSYAIRIINIPANHLDTAITACPYLTYECGGEDVTIYGEDVVATYNQFAN